MEATPLDLKLPGWTRIPVPQRAAPVRRAVEIALAGAALTDILLRLLHGSRAVATRAARTTDTEERLRGFERAYERATGERLSTAAFYDRFCAGEFDTRFGARWARCYEATLSRPARSDGLSHLGLRRPARG